MRHLFSLLLVSSAFAPKHLFQIRNDFLTIEEDERDALIKYLIHEQEDDSEDETKLDFKQERIWQ